MKKQVFERRLVQLHEQGPTANDPGLRTLAFEHSAFVQGVEPIIVHTIHGYYSAIFLHFEAGEKLVRIQIGEIEAQHDSDQDVTRYRPVFFSGAEGFANRRDSDFMTRDELKKRMFEIVAQEQVMFDLRKFGHYSVASEEFRAKASQSSQV